MVLVTEERDSGVELLDTDVELMEGTDGVHFRTEEPVTIEVGLVAGNTAYVDARYFVAADANGTREVDPMEAMMGGIDPEDDDVTQTEDGLEIEVDESSVFISNEEGELGGGFIQIDGGDLDDAIEQFEDDHL